MSKFLNGHYFSPVGSHHLSFFFTANAATARNECGLRYGLRPGQRDGLRYGLRPGLRYGLRDGLRDGVYIKMFYSRLGGSSSPFRESVANEIK